MTKYILEVARREGVSPEEVYAQIQAAIAAAWENPIYRKKIAMLTRSALPPTPDELIWAARNKVLTQEEGGTAFS